MIEILSKVLAALLMSLTLFCSKCGTLGFPNKDGVIDCSKCGSKKEIEQEVETDTGVVSMRDVSSSDEPDDLSHLSTPVDSTNSILAFIRGSICMFCGESTVTSELRQMDQSDEPEVRFLICHSCGKVWRD